jgi:hypothetical protein
LNNPEFNNSIIFIADNPILNPTRTKEYQNLSVNYSVFLNTLLFSNWVELLSTLRGRFGIFYFLDKNDEEYVPKYLIPQNLNSIFYNRFNLAKFSQHFSKYTSGNTSKILLLFYNSLGLTQDDIIRVFDLIQSDEPSIVIGKSVRDQIVFICTSGNDLNLIDQLFQAERKYNKYLKSISNKDIFIHTLENFLAINDFEDIKKLYIELSKKESLSYCSQKIHESFNDLFIEYKELLNG